jgi:hypothetical protein
MAAVLVGGREGTANTEHKIISKSEKMEPEYSLHMCSLHLGILTA